MSNAEQGPYFGTFRLMEPGYDPGGLGYCSGTFRGIDGKEQLEVCVPGAHQGHGHG